MDTFDYDMAIKDRVNDWYIESEHTYTRCTPSDNNNVICSEGINLRWNRDFDTSDSQDAILNVGRAGDERTAFFFLYEWADDKFASTPIDEYLNSEVWMMTPVTCQGVAIQDGTDVSACTTDVGKKLKDTAD